MKKKTAWKQTIALALALGLGLSVSFASFAGQWEADENGWKYQNDDGSYMANQGQWIDDKYYYFNNDGYIIYNTITPEEQWIGGEGYWISESNIDQEAMAEKSLGGTLIVYDKFSHQMELWINGEKTYSCVGASAPIPGDKEIEGDCRTPVGEFYVCVKNSKSKFHLSLGLSYPNIEDAERGKEQGLISEEQYRNIVNAIANGGKPDWYTILGGEIMIHGERGVTDDTKGCIAIKNSDIDYIWKYVTVGTKVIIQ